AVAALAPLHVCQVVGCHAVVNLVRHLKSRLSRRFVFPTFCFDVHFHVHIARTLTRTTGCVNAYASAMSSAHADGVRRSGSDLGGLALLQYPHLRPVRAEVAEQAI